MQFKLPKGYKFLRYQTVEELAVEFPHMAKAMINTGKVGQITAVRNGIAYFGFLYGSGNISKFVCTGVRMNG